MNEFNIRELKVECVFVLCSNNKYSALLYFRNVLWLALCTEPVMLEKFLLPILEEEDLETMMFQQSAYTLPKGSAGIITSQFFK
jgi:hypothetical protein